MCKLRNNCSCLPCKQNPSSDHTGKNPSEDQNGNCTRTRGIPTRKGDKRPNHESQNTDTQGMRAPDQQPAFDSISHDKLWVTMMHLIDLLAKLYRKKLTKVEVEWFRVKKGVQQGCVLSPYLFNILAEMVMRETLDTFQGGLQIAGRMLSSLCR